MKQYDDFAISIRAFGLFTLAEQRKALERFAQLRYPSITDRFFEAVHQVIREANDAKANV